MAQTQLVGRRRWVIGFLLGAGILINYFDRVNISVAAPQLQQEFGLTPADLGLLFSAFFWSYAILQIPIGIVLDRFGVMTVSRIGAFLWGVASGIVAFASGFGFIFGARVLLGVAEAPAFPANSKATGYWFPRGERATATAIFDAAAKFSNVIGVPLVAVAVVTFGWRWGFGLTAILSFAYFVAYWLIYRDPSADTKLTREERDYIRKGGATPEGESEASPIGMLGYLLRNRKVWGLTIGFAAYGYSFYLFLTWLPGYLVSEMHMSIIKSAGYAAIPWLSRRLRSCRRRLAHRSPAGEGLRRHEDAQDGAGRRHDSRPRRIRRDHDGKSGVGDILDHHRAERPRGGGAGRVVDPVAHRPERRDGYDRRRDELLQQPHGRRGARGHRLRRRRDEFLFARLPGGGRRALGRHLLLRRRAGENRADPGAGRSCDRACAGVKLR